jgi:hypothetical protein
MMTQAEKICANVSADIKPQAVTLANAVIAMQAKIDQQIPIYEQMPLAQQVTVGTGERMLRQNPAVQEFRATVREYAQALNNLQQLVGEAEGRTVESETSENVIKLLGNSRWKKRA